MKHKITIPKIKSIEFNFIVFTINIYNIKFTIIKNASSFQKYFPFFSLNSLTLKCLIFHH